MSDVSGELGVQTLLSSMPEFKPFAYYDKHLDAIRVQIKDCSIWEQRLDRFVTLYHDNYSPNADRVNDVVGFVIKGVRHLLVTLEINPDKAIKLAELLNEIVKAFPSETTQRIVEIYRGFEISNDDIELAIAA